MSGGGSQDGCVECCAVGHKPVSGEVGELREMVERLCRVVGVLVADKAERKHYRGAAHAGETEQRNTRGCFICQDPTHWARQCPLRDSGTGDGGRAGVEVRATRVQELVTPGNEGGHFGPHEVPGGRGSRRCYGCGSTGHLVRGCPNRHLGDEELRGGRQVGPREGVMVRGYGMGQPVYLSLWYGQQKLKCLLDSGCQRSVMPRGVVERETVDAADQVLFAVDGARLDTRGVVRISLELDGMVLPVEALVSDQVKEPMLGIDFLMRNHCVLNFGNGTVTVQGRSFPLEEGENSNVVHVRRVVTSRSARVSEGCQTEEAGQGDLTPLKGIALGEECVVEEEVALGPRQAGVSQHFVLWAAVALVAMVVAMLVVQPVGTTAAEMSLGRVGPVMVTTRVASMVVEARASAKPSHEGEKGRRHSPDPNPSTDHAFPPPSRSNSTTSSTPPIFFLRPCPQQTPPLPTSGGESQ